MLRCCFRYVFFAIAFFFSPYIAAIFFFFSPLATSAMLTPYYAAAFITPRPQRCRLRCFITSSPLRYAMAMRFDAYFSILLYFLPYAIAATIAKMRYAHKLPARSIRY